MGGVQDPQEKRQDGRCCQRQVLLDFPPTPPTNMWKASVLRHRPASHSRDWLCMFSLALNMLLLFLKIELAASIY